MKKATLFARCIGSVVLMACAVSAQATTFSFTGAAEGGTYTNPSGSVNGPSLYTAEGYQFLATGTDGHFHEDLYSPDSVYMHSNYGTTTTNTWVLSAVGNTLFDVSSFTMDAGALTWVTNLGTSGTGFAGLNNVALKGITSLTFSLATGGGYGSMDQFVVNATAVPEPATGALVLAGLGMLGVVARRKKQTPAA